ncbi:DUF3592 domain-containing protein [Roseibium sp. M-1]
MRNRYAFYDRYRPVFYVLILGMGLYFLYLGLQARNEAQLLASEGATTKGVVLAKRTEYRRYNPDGLGSTLHLLSYRYQVDGIDYVDESGVKPERYAETGPGDAVAVHYARGAPQISELTRGSVAAFSQGLFFFGFGVLGLVVLMVVVDRIRDRLKKARLDAGTGRRRDPR